MNQCKEEIGRFFLNNSGKMQIYVRLNQNKPFPANIYLFKVNNRNTRRKKFKICSKLTIKTPEQHQSFWVFYR